MADYSLQGYGIKGVDPQVVADTLLDLASQHGDKLTPQLVVASAKNRRSPIHDLFSWDDAEAAEQWRLQQARWLIRSVKIRYEESDDQEPQHLFCHIRRPESEEPPTRYYAESRVVMRDPILREHVLQEALRELQLFQKKYRQLSELAAVFTAIDSTLDGAEERA